jgi:hypothetical protein
LPVRRHITRVLYAAVAAGIALGTVNFAGGGSPARAAPQAISSPSYGWPGYAVSGRWFRFLSTTVTLPPISGPTANQSVLLGLGHGTDYGQPFAQLEVYPGQGDVYFVNAHVSQHEQPGELTVLPRPGDQLAISMYYDQRGHDYFTATDITQHVTRTVRVNVGNVVYDHGVVIDPGGWILWPPQADTQMLNFTGGKVTTYRGDQGTLTGPWTTRQSIATTTGTAAGTVIASPSALSGGGANFGIWQRAIPVTYTSGFAGYADSIGPFRFISTTMTMPPAQTPAGNGGTALVGLGHNGGATPRPYANIMVKPGGGAASISYASNNAAGAFTVNPAPGDRVRVSIYYDQKGHNVLTAADTTRGTTQTVTIAALAYTPSMPLNSAEVLAMFDNSTVVAPPADAQLWQFTGNTVTTYRGERGAILGPWATSQWIDTANGTRTGAVVADASVLSHAEHVQFVPGDFSIWLRHH